MAGINKLTARKVASLTAKGMYGDGAGLWLQIAKAGSKSWVFRYTRNKKAIDMGLGSVTSTTLAQARTKAQEYRAILQTGQDPKKEREKELAGIEAENQRITFEECATQYIDLHKSGWSNAKHTQQWTNSLKTYAYPAMGGVAVKDIDEGIILKALTPIWADKTETASRVRCRIENILSWAAVHKYRDKSNPAQWKGNLEHALPNPTKLKKEKHHKALPYPDIYHFMQQLRKKETISAYALEFLILNASRTSDVTGALWDEIDLSNGTWVIPAERMKLKKEHRVMLSSRALEIINAMHTVKHSAYIFPSTRQGKGLSNAAMSKLLNDTMQYDYTVHGFRSTFRDWAAELSNHSHEVCEMALAHVIKNKSEAAYRRGDMIEKRRKLTADWLTFINTPPNNSANVIPIKKAV